MRRTLLAAVLVAACSLPEHENPFDPATPTALQARATLTGRVTLEASGGITPPAGGIAISVLGLPTVTTAADGTWRTEQVPPGTYTVRASKDVSWEDAVVTGIVVTLDDGDRTLEVPELHLRVARGSVGGTVTLAGQPLGGWGGTAVTLPGVPGAAFTDAAGQFLFAGVPVIAGSYSLTASRAGFEERTVSPVNVALAQETVVPSFELALDLSGGIEGTAAVARPAGADGDIQVSLSGVDLNGTPVDRVTFTAADGTWQIPSLPQGTYALAFAKTRYETVTAGGLVLRAGEILSAPSVLLPVASGAVEGAVLLDVSTVPGFPPVADRYGTVVTLTDGGTTVASAVTDADGHYRFASVPALTAAASYVVTAQRPNFATRTVAVVPQPDTPVTAGDLSLPLSAGSLGGLVELWDNVGGAGTNASSAGAQVSISGTAFNGVAWAPPPFTTPDSGAWLFAALPPGTYSVALSSPGRSCASHAPAVVGAGAATDAGSRRCTDAIAPGTAGLGAPLATGGGIPGWVSGTSATVPLASAATDATSPAPNLRGYQTSVGAAPSWDAASLVSVAPAPPTQLVFGGLAPDATNTLWVRAIDWAGNAGPASSVQVVQDSTAPARPTINSPRSYVPDTTATVTFTGSDADPSFLRYEACTATVASGDGCPGAVPCAFAPAAQSYPVLLVANQRTCLWARAVDKAGLASAVASTSIVSDIVAPGAPVFRPSYDPGAVTVRAEWVDLFLATPSSDAAWSGAWSGVAWIEVDTGSGFQPLCPAAACHAGDRYDPCAAGCSCIDARLRCDGTSFTGIRVPLASASRNSIAVRSVDLAGNASSAISQEVATETSAGIVAATSAYEMRPRVLGNVVTYTRTVLGGGGGSQQVIVNLGENRRYDPSDASTVVTGSTGVLASRSLLAYLAGGQIALRRAPAGAAVGGADVTTALGVTPALYLLGASGEQVAWVASSGGQYQPTVRAAGGNGVLGDGDDETTALGNYGWVWDVELAGSHLHAMLYGDTTAGIVHRVFSAAGKFASGYTTFDLPESSVPVAALSPDGTMLAYVDQAASRLVLRLPTAAHYTAGDVTRTRALPAGFGTADAIAVEGNHVIVSSTSVGFLHWDAGPDGAFGTADDLYATLKPSRDKRDDPCLSAGLLLYEENNDVFALDLTSVRWEDVPAGYGNTSATVATVSGSVLFGGVNPFGGSMPLVARCPSGRDTSPMGSAPSWFSGDGDYVVSDPPGGLWLYTRDTGGPSPSGCFFTGSGSSQQILSTWIPTHSVVLGERVLAGNRPQGPTDTTVTAIEPSVAGGALTAGFEPVVLATGIDYPYGLGLTPTQAVYYCGRPATGYRICVKGVGSGGLFRDADAPAEAVLLHPPSAPVALRGTPVNGQHVKVSALRAAIGSYDPALYLLGAGADARFSTSDDTEVVVVAQRLDDSQFAIGGSWIAYVASGPPGGDQVYLYDVRDGSRQQLTAHVSAKKNVAVDASGRVWWEDGVFGNTWSLWVRTP